MLLSPLRTMYAVFVLLVMSCMLLPAHAEAKAAVGKVIISVGKSTALQADGATRKLKRRSEVFEGDVISTGKKSRLQIRFKDGQLVALKADTEFKIDEYKFTGKEDGTESASMSLFKGGMRAITGAIGKSNKDAYKLKTPVATLGVRGTHYGLVLCTANCGVDANGEPRKPGLYGGVVDGEISMSNNFGESTFSDDQYFFIADLDSEIVKLLVPPDIIFGQDETPPEEGDTGDTEGAAVDGDGEPLGDDIDAAGDTLNTNTDPAYKEGEQRSDLDNFAVTNPRFDSVSPAPEGSIFYVSSVETPAGGLPDDIAGPVDPATDFVLLGSENGIDNLLAQALVVEDPDCFPCIFDPGTATLTDVGGDSMRGVNWGTWNGDYVVFEAGVLVQTNGHFSFIYSPNVTPALPITGTVFYQYQDGPPLYDQAGNAYSFGTSSFLDVDFGNGGQITGGFFEINGVTTNRNFSLNATPTSVSQFLNDGVALSGTCSGCAVMTATGRFNGSFIGPNAEDLIGSISAGAGADVVTGVGLFSGFPGGL